MTTPSNLIVIGASPGDMPALQQIVGALPAELNAAVCIVMHTTTIIPASLEHILRATKSLPVTMATDGQALVSGEILVMQTDHQLVIKRKRLRRSRAARDHGAHTSLDGLFESAAKSFGTRAIGVILTGALTDGKACLQSIREAGGATLIQIRSEAERALRDVPIDYPLRLLEIASVLTRLVNQAPPATRNASSISRITRPRKRARTPYRCLP